MESTETESTEALAVFRADERKGKITTAAKTIMAIVLRTYVTMATDSLRSIRLAAIREENPGVPIPQSIAVTYCRYHDSL